MIPKLAVDQCAPSATVPVALGGQSEIGNTVTAASHHSAAVTATSHDSATAVAASCDSAVVAAALHDSTVVAAVT